MLKYLTQAILFLLLSASSVHAATHNIHIEWLFDDSQAPTLSGFRLYQDDIAVCSTADPAARAMDCTFESPYGTYNFYLAAIIDASSSPLSAPFPFTLTGPPIAQIAASQISLSDTLTLELNPGNSEGDITSYKWSFSDGSPDVINSGETITHTFPANKVSTYTLTVTDVNGDEQTIRLSTITFLKQIHAIVIYHINSFLLRKDREQN